MSKVAEPVEADGFAAGCKQFVCFITCATYGDQE